MNDIPLVSVIVTCYNLQDYILECLQSLAEQDYPAYEVLVVDDGSRDDSTAIVEDYIAGKPGFRLIRKENGGAASARNAGIQASSGQWITFVDGDDLLMPRFLSSMIEALQEHPADMCTAGMCSMDNRNGEQEVFRDAGFSYGSIQQKCEEYNSFGCVTGRLFSGDIIRRNHVFFDDNMRYEEDCPYMFHYLSYVGAYLFVPYIGYCYRVKREGSQMNCRHHPSQKGHPYQYVRLFFEKISQKNELKEILLKNNKLLEKAGYILISELTNLLLEKDREKYIAVINDSKTKILLSCYKPVSAKDRLLALLAKRQIFLPAAWFMSIYNKVVLNR